MDSLIELQAKYDNAIRSVITSYDHAKSFVDPYTNVMGTHTLKTPEELALDITKYARAIAPSIREDLNNTLKVLEEADGAKTKPS
jgi:hypothetical protein